MKSRPSGDLYPGDLPVVGSAPAGHGGRLDVGHPEMLAALARQTDTILTAPADQAFPYRLLCRRANHVYNSSCNFEVTNRGVFHNPAYLNPADLADLGIEAGTVIRISSSLSTIRAIAAADPDLRRGTVSIAFGFGPESSPEDLIRTGSSPNRLIPADEIFDPYTGQPRMSNLPVSVQPDAASCPGAVETGEAVPGERGASQAGLLRGHQS